MDKQYALKSLINLTNQTFGFTPGTPSEFSELSISIQRKRGRGTDFDDSGFIEESVVSVERLHTGDRILLQWGKGKSCEIEYLSNFRFRVNQSKNIKLLVGDTFTINILCLRHPIFISNIERGDRHIPAYIGARKGGITSITLIPA